MVRAVEVVGPVLVRVAVQVAHSVRLAVTVLVVAQSALAREVAAQDARLPLGAVGLGGVVRALVLAVGRVAFEEVVVQREQVRRVQVPRPASHQPSLA